MVNMIIMEDLDDKGSKHESIEYINESYVIQQWHDSNLNLGDMLIHLLRVSWPIMLFCYFNG